MNGGTRKPGYTIQVVGLSPSVRKTDIQSAFGDYGQIVRIDLVGAKAYLEFDDKHDAKEAIEAWDGRCFQGCALRVDMKSKDPPAARSAALLGQRRPAFDGQKNPSDDAAGVVPQANKPALDGQRKRPDDAVSALPQTQKTAERSSVPERRRKDQGRKRRRSSSWSGSSSRERSRRTTSKETRGHEHAVLKPKAAKARKVPTDNKEIHGTRSTKAKKQKQKVQQSEAPPRSAMGGRLEDKADELTRLPMSGATSGMDLGFEGSSSSQPTDVNEASIPPAPSRPGVALNWSHKVQEWLAKKAKGEAQVPSELQEYDVGAIEISEPAAAVPALSSKHTAATDEAPRCGDQAQWPTQKSESAAVPQLVAGEKAEKLAAAAQKCESAAVQRILDRALAAKRAAAACAEPALQRPAASSQPPAAANATVSGEDTRPASAARVLEYPSARSRSCGRRSRSSGRPPQCPSDPGAQHLGDSAPAGRERGPIGGDRAHRSVELRPASFSREPSQRRESDLVATSRNRIEEKHRRLRSVAPRRRSASCSSGSSDSVRRGGRNTGRRSGSASPRLRDRVGAGGFDRTQRSPSQHVADPAPCKIDAETPAVVQPAPTATSAARAVPANVAVPPAPAATIPARTVPAIAAVLPTPAGTIPTRAVPSWVFGVQADGLVVQADGQVVPAHGMVFGHGGIVDTASGEWLCPRCRWRNYNTRRQCVQCKLGRPM